VLRQIFELLLSGGAPVHVFGRDERGSFR
jgi:hypothetical protein